MIVDEGKATDIRLEDNSLKVFEEDICLRELESELNDRGYSKRIVGSQGWNIIEKEYEKNVIEFLVKNEWKNYL